MPTPTKEDITSLITETNNSYSKLSNTDVCRKLGLEPDLLRALVDNNISAGVCKSVYDVALTFYVIGWNIRDQFGKDYS